MAESINKVMEFFFFGKSHKGKVFTIKSKNMMVMKKGGDSKCELLEEIVDAEVVSCDQN